MKILTLSEIDFICKKVVQSYYFINPFVYASFSVLYNTGLRVSEVLDFSKWQEINEQQYLLHTAKRSNPRIININQLNEIYLSFLQNYKNIGFDFSYKYLANAFNSVSPIYPLFVGNKRISTHLFRHRKAKKLIKLGYSNEFVKNYLSEKEQKSANTYIYSKVMHPI